MSQSRRMSLIESVVNVVTGIGVAVLMTATIYPLLGTPIPIETNLIAAIPFTVASMIRSYTLRRLFNWLGKHLD